MAEVIVKIMSKDGEVLNERTIDVPSLNCANLATEVMDLLWWEFECEVDEE